MNIIYLLILGVVVLLGIFVIIRKKSAGQSSVGDSTQLYVGNLSYSLKDYQLKKEFASYGDIVSVRIIKHPQSRRSKGFGFITFESPKSIKKALKMHGKELDGRCLVVRVANERQE